jgi:predicted nucleic acid-binding Zn ribbon protein
MKCPNCGSELRADSVFCQGCGFYLQGRQAHRKAGSTWIVVLVILAVVVVAGFAAYALLSRLSANPSPQSQTPYSDSGIAGGSGGDTPDNDGQTVFSHFGSVVQSGGNASSVHQPNPGQPDTAQPGGGTSGNGQSVNNQPQTETYPSDNTGSSGGGEPSAAPDAAQDEGLLGLWSASGTSGELVDPATGLTTGSYYSGEWYLFREDGTFRYVIISSGQIISGGVVQEGKYTVTGGEILLTDIRESWYPDLSLSNQEPGYQDKKVSNETRTYEYADSGTTLILDGLDYFYWVEP